MTFAIIVFLSAILFIVLDLIWFSFAGNFFKSEIGEIARLKADGSWDVNIFPAILVYLIMGIGIAVFVHPNTNDLLSAVLLGGLLGLVGYGLYDLTNLATLKHWTVRFTLVDMVWGTFLCATVSAIIYLVGQSLF